MKNVKLIIISMAALSSITNISAMQRRSHVEYSWDEPYDRTEYNMASAIEQMRVYGEQQKRAEELKALRIRRAREARTMKPLTKVTGIGTLNQLLLQDSDEARNAELNRLPMELKESLISLIDDRKQLLDRNQPNEAALVEDLNMLQKQIQQNLNQ